MNYDYALKVSYIKYAMLDWILEQKFNLFTKHWKNWNPTKQHIRIRNIEIEIYLLLNHIIVKKFQDSKF